MPLLSIGELAKQGLSDMFKNAYKEKAKIIVIGDFWDKERNAMRQQAAESQGCPFADLAPIIGDKAYQSKEGTECTLEDGSTMTVSKEAETHPGDAGMEYIAAQVLGKL